MRTSHLLTASLAVVVLAGAGCLGDTNQSNLAIKANDANSESALAPRELNLGHDPETTTTSASASASASADTAPTSAPSTPSTPPSPSPSTMPTPSANGSYTFPGVLPQSEIHAKQVRIVTAKGEIVFDLLDGEAPKTVSNFVYLAKQGYFNNLKFHRVVPHFVIQGGDPLSADESKQAYWGTGGPGYKFEDEKVSLDYDAGIVAMANSGPNTNGSQFFIMIDDNPTLPKDYTIFGRVTKGLDTVRAIGVGDVMEVVTVENK